MEPHQQRILGRVADEIERYRSGQASLRGLLTNVWGLFAAADIPESREREEFLELFYELNSEDDARQSWMPPGIASDERLDATLTELEAWAVAVRERSDSPT
jgi:hypothetical protein